MNKNKLSLQTRKCLRIQLGDRAGNEIYNLINGMNEEIDNLRRNKTDAAMTSLRKGWDQASKMPRKTIFFALF